MVAHLGVIGETEQEQSEIASLRVGLPTEDRLLADVHGLLCGVAAELERVQSVAGFGWERHTLRGDVERTKGAIASVRDRLASLVASE